MHKSIHVSMCSYIICVCMPVHMYGGKTQYVCLLGVMHDHIFICVCMYVGRQACLAINVCACMDIGRTA